MFRLIYTSKILLALFIFALCICAQAQASSFFVTVDHITDLTTYTVSTPLVYCRENNKFYYYDNVLTSWEIYSGAITSVNTQTGIVVLGKSDIGLGSVDNTSDANKPVSTATQSALNLKAPLASPTFTGTVAGVTASMVGLGNVDNTSDATKNAANVVITNHSISGTTNTLSNIAESSVTNLTTDLAAKVNGNTAITGATNTKITYDTKGLVTSGAAATTADISDSLNRRYVTDAQQTVITNTSGINSGDQTITLTGDVTGSGAGSFAATIGTNKVTTTTVNANAVTLAKLDASNATANKVLMSGASASPTWSIPTFPNASATLNKFIKSDGTNWIASTGSASGTGSCTNQVVTVTNADAAPTCASISNAMLATGTYSQGTFVATCSGTATSSSTLFLFPIGQISALTCTITTAASGIPMPAAGTIKNLRFVAGAGGKSGDAVTILKNASATGMPTCIFGTTTTCNDTSTNGSVIAGDLITIKIVTGVSDTLANVQVSFQFWN